MAKYYEFSKHAKIIHWSMAFIIITVWFIGFYTAHFRGNLPRGGFSLELHKSIGSLVLFMMVWRLLYRLSHSYPQLRQRFSKKVYLTIKIAHLLLYIIVMTAVPLSGWYWSSVAGSPPQLLGIIQLPAIATTDHSHYALGMWLHRLIAWSAGLLILGHIMAALKHRFYDKDDIFQAMWPFKKSN